MRTNLTFRLPFLALLMAALIFITPFTTLAQQKSVEVQAKMAAKRDAETDTNKWLWTGVGFVPCFSVVLGVMIGSLGPQSWSGSGYSVSDQQGCGMLLGATVGCFIPLIAINAYRPGPHPERLLGKSPEYIDLYTDAYKTRIRLLRRGWAAGGVAITVGGLINAIFLTRSES